MKQSVRKIVWILLGLTPFLLWWEIYRTTTTEYDGNWFHFFMAVLLSLLTVGLLFLVRKGQETDPRQKKLIRAFAVLLGSPLTIGFLVLYYQTIPMQWKWSSSYIEEVGSYSEVKRRNFFKAENLLIMDRKEASSDTIMAVVSRNGALEKLVRLEEGRELALQESVLDSLTADQKKQLTSY